VRVYDQIIVGDGPVSRVLQVEMLSRGSECLVLDSGVGLRQLAHAIEIDSNVNYVAQQVAPSFNQLGSDFSWAGGCQGWPLKDFGLENGPGLPLNPTSNEYKSSIRTVNRHLGIWNFNFHTDRPYIQVNWKRSFKNEKIKRIYCKVLKDPKLLKLHKKTLKNRLISFNDSFVLKKIVPSDEFITLHGIDPKTNRGVQFKCLNLSLCLGTIENTRVLLLSSEELCLNNDKHLGKNLSDHLALKYATIHTTNLPRVIRDFARPKTVDGGRLWPRLKSMESEEHSLSNSFMHADQFCFDGDLPLLYRVLRRLGKENYYFSKKRAGRFDLNIFSEKRNDETNHLELIENNLDSPPKLRVKFMVAESEVEELISIGQYWENALKSEYGSEIGLISIIPNSRTIYGLIHAGSHPSGVYRMSSNPNEGVINRFSELWAESRIRVMGSGSYGRASSTHPTYTSMVLGILGLRK
jgi:hypothetical protein